MEVAHSASFFMRRQASLPRFWPSDSPRYIRAARSRYSAVQKVDIAQAAAIRQTGSRNPGTLGYDYLKTGPKDQQAIWTTGRTNIRPLEVPPGRRWPFLKERKKPSMRQNLVKAGAREGDKPKARGASLPTESYYLWRDLFFSDFYGMSSNRKKMAFSTTVQIADI